MDIIRKIKRFFRRDYGHVAVITLPEEVINGGWYEFSMTVDGWSQKHDGNFTTFSGKVRVDMYDW